MKRLFFFILVCAAGISCCNTRKSDSQHFQKADAFGSIHEGVEEYLQDIRDLEGTGELNSVMVLKDGKILEEYYDVCYGPDFLNICWSASKTFTATAVGFAVQDGLLDIDDKIVNLLEPEMLPATVSDTLSAVTVRDLLIMSSGLKIDIIGPVGSLKVKNPVKTVLETGFKFFPGEKFAYNSINTYILSVIVTKVTGKLVQDYLQEKLFGPMGIRNYHWDLSAEGYNTGGWGLYMTTEGLAKMGQFFLQKGQWNGRQLLDPAWIEAATSPQIYKYPENKNSDDWNCGYGYQMWCCSHNAVRLDGAHGQWVVICPDKNAVIVITGNVKKTHVVFPSVWSRIYDKI